MDDLTRSLIDRIEHFEPTDKSWKDLDAMLEELFTSGDVRHGVDAMLRLFERFPEGDGCEVFWSILHGLESIPNYEETLIESVQRQPSEFGIIMVNRILNTGQTDVNGANLTKILEQAVENPSCPESVRELARRFLERHRPR